MQFAYEALQADGRTVADQIEAGDRNAAADSLRERGLIVLRLDAAVEAAGRTWLPNLHLGSQRIKTRDLILFTRQMKMLLEAGTPLVPALEAVEHQSGRPAVGAVLGRLRKAVEEGGTLTKALDDEPTFFTPVFKSMIAAGEATASLPQVFGRLSGLAQQQQQARKMVIGALTYPLILSTLMLGVVCILLFFVVPRFTVLFMNLQSPLPETTKLLFAASQFLKAHGLYVLGGLVALVVAAVVAWRSRTVRTRLDEILLRMPVVGPLMNRLTFARVLRVWAAMLRCHVPLLETIRQSRDAVTNAVFLNLLTAVEEAVSSGGRMGQALADTGMAPPIVVSAIRTGEENGRLAEAIDFVSSWLDEENTGLVQQLTRMAEPILLALMGVIVGFVAMSLFVPLFDLATAA